MKYCLGTILSILSLIIISCVPLNEDTYYYKADIYLFNSSNQTLKIQTDKTDNSIYLTKFQYCHLSQTSNDNIYTAIKNIPIEKFDLKSYVEIYSVPDNELLKKWTYEDRDNDGKQLFRLSDHRYTIKQKDNLMLISFKFHITDEDLQNQ